MMRAPGTDFVRRAGSQVEPVVRNAPIELQSCRAYAAILPALVLDEGVVAVSPAER